MKYLVIQILRYKEGAIFIGLHKDRCGPLGDNHREYEGGYSEYHEARIGEKFDEPKSSSIRSGMFYTLVHIIEALPLQGNH